MCQLSVSSASDIPLLIHPMDEADQLPVPDMTSTALCLRRTLQAILAVSTNRSDQPFAFRNPTAGRSRTLLVRHARGEESVRNLESAVPLNDRIRGIRRDAAISMRHRRTDAASAKVKIQGRKCPAQFQFVRGAAKGSCWWQQTFVKSAAIDRREPKATDAPCFSDR